MDDSLHLEGAPTDDQKDRLENFLSELMFSVRRWGICFLDPDEVLQFVDMSTGNTVGIGLTMFTAPGDDTRITGYLPADSILDGAWLVDGPDGPVEQRLVQNVFPLRP